MLWPTRSTSNSAVSTRYYAGKRTAWLPPFVKTFAVLWVIGISWPRDNVSTNSIYPGRLQALPGSSAEAA